MLEMIAGELDESIREGSLPSQLDTQCIYLTDDLQAQLVVPSTNGPPRLRHKGRQRQ